MITKDNTLKKFRTSNLSKTKKEKLSSLSLMLKRKKNANVLNKRSVMNDGRKSQWLTVILCILTLLIL